MSITGIGNHYNNYYANVDSKAKEAATTENVQKEQEQQEQKFESVAEYTKYLQSKFSFFGKTGNVCGVAVTYTVSEAYLRKCINEPEKAADLERDLEITQKKAIPASVARHKANGTVSVYQNIMVDENGNGRSSSMSKTAPSGKATGNNGNGKKANRRQEEQERIEKRRQEKKERQKEIEERIHKSLEIKKAEMERLNKNMEHKLSEKSTFYEPKESIISDMNFMA